MVVTEPLPAATLGRDRLAERRDDRRRGAVVRVHPADGRRPHRDRRSRPPYYWRSGSDRYGEVENWAVRRLTEKLHALWPATRDVAIAHAWSGVFGAQRDWMPPSPPTRHGARLGGGWVGEGVAAANLGGRILSDLLRGEQSELTALPWVNRPDPRPWEPEPLRFLGAHGVYWLIDQADRREERTGEKARLYDLAKLVSGRESE